MGSGAKPASASRTKETSASVARSSGSRNSDGDGRTFKTPVTTGKRKRGGAQLEAVEETEQDELETTQEDIAASRSTSIRPSIEVPASAQKTPAANQIEEPDELSPENDGPAIKNPIREIETPTLLRRLSERDTRRSEGSVAGSIILSIEQEDELSFQENQSATNTSQSSSGNRNSSSGLAMATSATDGLNVSLTAPNNQSTRREVFEIPEGEPVVDTLPTMEDLEDEEDELSPVRTTKSQSSRRTTRERRAVVEDDDEDELSPPKVNRPDKSRKTTREPPVAPKEIVEDNASEDELSPVQPTTRRQPVQAPIEARRNPNKRRRVEEPPIEVHQDETEVEASEIDELSPQQTRPARPVSKSKPQKSRQPLSKATTNLPKKTKQPKKPAEPGKKANGDVIGITVYQRTKSNNMAYDTLGSEPNPGITPIDVLAQVADELAANHIHAFKQQARPDNTSKKTKKRQVDAMGFFQEALSNTLSRIRITNLEAHVLGKQVRQINRRKRLLREELMGRRREREEVEIEIDRVRAVHREQVEREEKEFELVQSLRDIEGAVRRGREKAVEDGREDEVPEVRLEMVVGGAEETLGLLGRVREWNGVLEESARVLEERM